MVRDAVRGRVSSTIWVFWLAFTSFGETAYCCVLFSGVGNSISFLSPPLTRRRFRGPLYPLVSSAISSECVSDNFLEAVLSFLYPGESLCANKQFLVGQ